MVSMHYELVDKLPKKSHKYAYCQEETIEQLKVIKELGGKYYRVSTLFDDVAVDMSPYSHLYNTIYNDEEWSRIFAVKLINGGVYLVRKDLE